MTGSPAPGAVGGKPPRFSVVIPAHNEEAVIGRCLASLGEAVRDGEVVVVANGCTDRTADVARGVPGVTVLDVGAAGKARAIRRGEEACTALPRIYLDSDVTLSPGAFEALVDRLSAPGVRVAAPRVHFDVEHSTWPVRAFYRMYSRLPYVSENLVGLGVYGVSRQGRARFGTFPDVIADDLFVQTRFAPEETEVLDEHTFTVSAPRTLASLIAVRTRTVRGNAQLQQGVGTGCPEAGLATGAGETEAAPVATVRATSGRTATTLLREAVRSPRSLLDAVVYTGVVLAGRVRARRAAEGSWQRDESSRVVAHPARRPFVTPGPRVAYLVSQYPKTSHTFIHREVAGLRKAGVDVVTFTVRPCPEEELHTPELVVEAERTRSLLGTQSRGALLRRAGRLAARHPLAVLRTALPRLAGPPPAGRPRAYKLFYLLEGLLLLDWLRTDDLHHVHVHFANNGADVARAACDLADRVGYPLTWSFSMHGPTEFEDPIGYDLAGKVASASAVMCISEYCRGELGRLVPLAWHDKLMIVRMGILAELFPGRDALRADTAETGSDADDGALRVLFVGRLVPEKRPLDLVAALWRLREQGVAVRARFVGAGPLEGSLRAAVIAAGLSDAVELVGAQGEDQVPRHYAWADVFCLPSEAEGLPVVLMEALACELPVVTTRIAAVPELVQHDRNGLLVEPGDVVALAAALRRLAGDPALRTEFGRRGRATVLEEYDAHRNAGALALLWGEGTTTWEDADEHVA